MLVMKFFFTCLSLVILFSQQICAADDAADWTVILLSSFLIEEDYLFHEILPMQEIKLKKYQVPTEKTLCDLARYKPSNIVPGRVIIIGMKECNQDPQHFKFRKSLEYFK
jgi:hypothetical protein